MVMSLSVHVPVQVRSEGADDLQDEPDPRLFATEVSNCAGSSLSLAIWSAKVQTTSATFLAYCD